MQLFRYADLTLNSTLPLAELSVDRRDQAVVPDLTCHLLETSPPELVIADWIYHWQAKSGAPALSLARTGQGFLLRFTHLANFHISADGCQVGTWSAPETNAETLRHLLLDQVLPRLIAHRGRLVLHAGAVRVEDQAIAFVGQTGWGKSTLVASFYAAGYPLLSDDGMVLTPGEGCALALPTYPSLRLWPEAVASLFTETPDLAPVAHYSSKQRVAMAEVSETARLPLPLAALYVLAPEAEADTPTISVTRLSPRDACMAIISNAFQLDVTDHRRAAGLLATAGDIAQRLPAFALSFPRDFAALPAVRAAILGQRDHWAGSAVDNPGLG